ncbi:hypothetical protein N7523_000266 [Penicillium sp. IBT 18751x]|nr:hypothetical protein N7523_000266 [Penicillium sp. IBT 18751x]
MTEEPQLGSIQERIAALKLAQAANPSGPEPPIFRPNIDRSRSANNPPSYNVTGSVLDSAPIGNEPAGERRPGQASRPPPTMSPKPEVKPKKPPPPLPTRRSDRLPPPTPARAEARPTLPPRRPTEPVRRPSAESVTSEASHSTAATSLRATSTASVNSNGNGRIKAPAWGETTLPVLPPRRPKEDFTDVTPSPSSRSDSRPAEGKSISGFGLRNKLSANVNSLRGKDSSSSTSSSRPSMPSMPSRSKTSTDTYSAPQPPSRRPSEQSIQSNGAGEEHIPGLPPRRLPPRSSQTDLRDARTTGFGNLNKMPAIPGRPNSTPAVGAPPPIPTGTRPDLSKLLATKPRFDGSAIPASLPVGSSHTDCLVCRDFSAPDQHAAQYPRHSLPTQDLGWLANELTAPFPSLTDKARAIFTWLHHNIRYDVDAFFNNRVKPSTPASTLASGLAVCEGFAGLFAALATKAGLESIVISGHGKGFGHEELAPSSPIPPFSSTHAWNAVKIDGGRWKLIDPCWGGGHIQGAGQPYMQVFDPLHFTMSNDVFGLKHFPSNKEHFFRDDGRPQISWEEYMRTNPDSPSGGSPIRMYCGVGKNDIGKSTLYPTDGRISVYNTPSPVRFQFGLLCEHWTLARHSRRKPGLFILCIHGVDGRKDERLLFNHVPGSGPGGGGEFWYVDVPDARQLGAPGQKVLLAVITKFGDREEEECRGLTAEEYRAQLGSVVMAWAYVAEWELVA